LRFREPSRGEEKEEEKKEAGDSVPLMGHQKREKGKGEPEGRHDLAEKNSTPLPQRGPLYIHRGGKKTTILRVSRKKKEGQSRLSPEATASPSPEEGVSSSPLGEEGKRRNEKSLDWRRGKEKKKNFRMPLPRGEITSSP